MKLHDDKFFYRAFELDRRAVDKKNRSVDLSFSSETPIKRWFGDEYLLHGEGNVNLSRLKKLGAALFGHVSTFIVGALKNIRVEENKGRATVVFDDDEDGEKVWKKVLSGSLKGVSVGYLVQQFREVLKDETFEVDGKKFKGPAMVALRWTPYEISFTPIPADATVGVGRELTRSLDGIQIIKSRKDKLKMNMANLGENRNKPMLEAFFPNSSEREVIRALCRAAKYLGDTQFYTDCTDLAFDAAANGKDAAVAVAREINDRVDEVETEGGLPSRKIEQTVGGLRFSEVDDQAFAKSIETPLLIGPVRPGASTNSHKPAARPVARKVGDIDDAALVRSLERPLWI